MDEQPPLHRIIRRRDLPQFVGLQRTQIDALIASGQFPRPIPLSDSGRAVGWLSDEVAAWQRDRLAKRQSQATDPKTAAHSPLTSS
jgi:predicted DNA-binding transcriptional regulator AlpA